MTGGKIVAIIFGAFGLLAGAALVAGAAGILSADRDDDGFYTSEGHAFDRSSRAIVSEDLDILSDAPNWVVSVLADPLDLRISGSAEGSEGLFVGIGPTVDVDRYLSGVAHDEVTTVDFDGRSIRTVDYDRHEGTTTPAAPANEDFWETSTEGIDTQTLEWNFDAGNWTVVVMNADGSVGVDAELAFGVKVSNVSAIAWAVMGFGVLSLVGGAYLVYRGVRRARDSEHSREGFEPSKDALDLRDQPRIEDQLAVGHPALQETPARQD